MKTIAKKTGVSLLALAFALTLMVPALSFAQPGAQPTMTGMVDGAQQEAYNEVASGIAVAEEAIDEPADEAVVDGEALGDAAAGPVEGGAVVDEPTSDAASDAASADDGAIEDATVGNEEAVAPAGECTVTIQYLEYVDNIEPGDVVDEGGRVFLGTREITGLHEGDQVYAWDYVVNIPGHFFYDGWPLYLTVTDDPSQNIMKLIYMRLHNSEYTVNYYLLTGADLSADTWNEALATDDVRFTKMGSQHFENQEFNSLVEGDAYEYPLRELYVVDSYPAEIRLDTEPENNVLNVLYVGARDVEDGENPPDQGSGDNNGGGSGEVVVPGGTIMDKDEIMGVLPDDEEVITDFIGAGTEEVVITDEMLQDPIDKEQALNTLKAYQTGLQQAGLAQTGDAVPWLIVALVAVVAGAGIVIVSLMRRTEAAKVEARTHDEGLRDR